MNSNFLEIKKIIKEFDVPKGAAARPDMTKHLWLGGREIFCSHGGHSTGAHVGNRSRINNGSRYTSASIHQSQHAKL